MAEGRGGVGALGSWDQNRGSGIKISWGAKVGAETGKRDPFEEPTVTGGLGGPVLR